MVPSGRFILNRYFLVVVAVAVAVGLSLSSFFLVRQWERNRAERAFRGIATDRFRAIEEQMKDEALKLRLLRATYLSSVEAQSGSYTGFIREFRATVLSAMLADSATDTIAYIQAVPEPAREEVGATMRSHGYPGFRIFDRSSSGGKVVSAVRPRYFPIMVAEPRSQNGRLQGWDMASVNAYNVAMEKAEETGNPTASQAESLGSGSNAPTGFWMFSPLLEKTSSSDALLGDRTTVDGFVAIEFRVSGLVENALSGLDASGIDILVYDQTDSSKPILLYTHQSRTRSGSSGLRRREIDTAYRWTGNLQVGDRRWQIVAVPAPAFIRSHTYYVSWAVLGGGLLSTAMMVGFLVWYLRRTRAVEMIVAERTAQLSREIGEHEKAEQSLTIAHENLTRRVEIINQRSREIELLSEMGDLLQTCQELAEAYDVVARFGAQLFPTESGVLFMFNESHRFLESAAKWGPTAYGETVFTGDACWSLRRGRLHAVTEQGEGLICRHLGDEVRGRFSYFCLPLTALGETIGVLHIQRVQEEADREPGELDTEPSRILDQSRKRLAVALGEHAAMAFANLRLRETLRQQSIRDPLTSLFNRRYMEESLEREIHRARRSGSPMGVVILDIDHFKKFNDTYGHEAGDLVLKGVARLIQGSVRGEDIPCRFGGEEFVLILPNASLEASRQKAESIRIETQRISVEHGGQRLPQITVSLGVAVLAEGASGGTTLLQAADEALYRAKNGGRNRVESARS